MKLKEIRNAKGISQQQLAIKLGISRSTVAMWETGKSIPDAMTLNAIADYFKCTTDELLGRSASADPTEPILNARDERDIQKRLNATLGMLDDAQGALMFDGEPLDDETKELVAAALERALRQAKVLAKEKYTPKKYRKKENGNDAAGDSQDSK